jgi:hypothetical protein
MKPERLATILSILGVILTFASVVASVAQFRAADLQAQAAVVALMPQLEVRALLEKVDSDKFTDRRIEITSDGGPVHNLLIEHFTWIEFRAGGKVALREPLNGYYFAGYPSGRTRGLLYTIKGYRNNQVYFDFLEWARHALPSGLEISQPTTLLRISYRDALKRENTEFVHLVRGSETHLSMEEGQRMWSTKLQKSLDPRMLDINDLETQQKAVAWVNAWRPVLTKALGG